MTKYSSLFDLEHLETFSLPELDKSISRFSLVSYKSQEIFMTGGVDKLNFLTKVYVFDLVKDEWKTDEQAELNEARSSHSSIEIGQRLYVFCGYNGDKCLNSIECLDFDRQVSFFGLMEEAKRRWFIWEVDMLGPRENPTVCAYSNNEICIMGGYQGGHLSDVILVNFEHRTGRKVLRKSFMNFSC